MANQDDELYTKWGEWIKILDQEVIDLHTQRHIFQEVQDIIQENQVIQNPGDFNECMSIWYASSMSVAVRKQADNDKNSISYLRLLESIKSNPKVISRTRFKKNFVNRNYPDISADADFDKFVDIDREYVDLATINNEISELINRTAPLANYVNKRVAHRDKEEFTEIPTFEDLDRAIDFLGELHKKYYLIFRCGTIGNLPLVWQYEWKKVFRYPWITSQ